MDNKLLWSNHINQIRIKLGKGLYAPNRLNHYIPASALKSVYYTLIHPHLQYRCILWGNAPAKYTKLLKVIQIKAVRCLRRLKYNDCVLHVFKSFRILKLAAIL